MTTSANIKGGIFRFRIRPWGVVLAAGTLAGTASLLGFLGAYHWFLDLCSHFRMQYVLGLGLVSVLLLVFKRWRTAAASGVLAALNLGVILPLYFGEPSVPVTKERPVRALLANVNTQTGDAEAVAAAIRQWEPDIIVLEEVNARWLSKLKPVLSGYGYFRQEPRDDNFGIGLWSRFPFTRAEVVEIGSAGVPSIVAEIETSQGRCTVLATHPLPPIGKTYSDFRNNQLAELPRWVLQASSPVVLLGDLNTTPWNHYFQRLLRESNLQNSAQGRGIGPSWPTHNPLLRIPLDHCLFSDGIGIVARQTGPNVGSDHFPLIVDFVVQPRPPGN
jgi:endonuclease/exonuclease/phosphatase (EEP) superfamily protein YafD